VLLVKLHLSAIRHVTSLVTWDNTWDVTYHPTQVNRQAGSRVDLFTRRAGRL